MTSALSIIPQRQPSRRPQDSVHLPQRPKLHINTQQIRTFGKGSSLRLDTLSAVSPTVRNTFSNAYEAPASAAPATERPQRPRLGLSIDGSISRVSNSNPPSSSTPNSASTLSSAVTSSSNESATIRIPYTQPHNLNSILTNSPARQLITRKMAPGRPFFPAEKRVTFRTPLEEEIKTTKYTLAHSDLQSSASSSASTIASIETTSSADSKSSTISLSVRTASTSSSSSGSASASPSGSSEHPTSSSRDTSPSARAPRAGDKRDSSESDSDSAPETPVAGRRKRRRDWRWTLGPLPGSKGSSTTSAEASDEAGWSDDSF
ncbi:uncharacterized protein EI97DRAFT_436218 [Westerdykella ornata]|uniref:Uncharacterized protein n=1 Tax=Westerdykella ornata TaxID=318751 RepID=A0A6A6JDV1_WESOR|nr:uncharacterized protein EI97DRAFT_436218 [Westerdykella ornata]KAF2273359.1 hypothetical protein EI97DRAFT_436218 [Westerdykella ornata]